jgi:hypothetical protein
MLAILYCVVLALLAWAAAWAGWPVSHGAGVFLALLGGISLALALMPLMQPS